MRSLASAQHGSCRLSRLRAALSHVNSEVFDHACEALYRLGMLQFKQLRSDRMVRLLVHPSDAELQA
eukprot:2170132-Lingulodinium_polyedra.AAC.1